MRPVTLQLRVRRFWCCNTACPRQIFAERFPLLAADHARRTLVHMFAPGLASAYPAAGQIGELWYARAAIHSQQFSGGPKSQHLQGRWRIAGRGGTLEEDE